MSSPTLGGLLFVVPAVLWVVSVGILRSDDPRDKVMGLLVWLLSVGLWLLYCNQAVKAKGWPAQWTLLGVLGLLGGVALLCMPRRCLHCGVALVELVEKDGKFVDNKACQACGKPFTP